MAENTVISAIKNSDTATDLVNLICIKEGSKLRVRITSPGYLPTANCQFPRNLRIEGRRFRVPAENIKLIKSSNKWFYSIKKGITVVEEAEILENSNNSKYGGPVFEDEAVMECNICMCENKDTVFNPTRFLSQRLKNLRNFAAVIIIPVVNALIWWKIVPSAKHPSHHAY